MKGPHVSEGTMRLGLVTIGLTQVVVGLWLAIDPDSFLDAIADFGPSDTHFLRDLATFQLGIGIALLAAVGRPSWRAPVLFTALIMSALHTINHLADIGETDPGWQGPANFVSLLLLTILLGGLWRAAMEQDEQRPARAQPKPVDKVPA